MRCKKRDRYTKLSLGMTIVLCLLAFHQAKTESALDLTEPGTVIKGFSVPRFDKQGRITAKLYGQSAQILNREEILLQDMRYETISTNQPYFRFEAGNGVFNRKLELLN